MTIKYTHNDTHMSKQQPSNCSTLNTVSNVITAFFLAVLTIGLMVGGTWTAKTVNQLQRTYHPDKISNIIDNLSDTVSVIHNTTHMLHSTPHANGHSDILADIHQLAIGIEDLANALTNIPSLMKEAEQWRNISTSAFSQFKRVMASL